jgi:hypothetical protein
MTRSVGYIFCVCTELVPVRVPCARINRVRMLHETNYRQRFIYRHCVLNSHVYSKRSNRFSPNLLWTYYYSALSVKDYVLFMFTHRARECMRAERTRMCAFAYFLTDYVQICWEHTTTNHKLQGLCTFHCHAPRVRLQARICERVSDYSFTYLWTDSLQIFSEHTTSHIT